MVLFVLIKSCQGIAYSRTNECRIYKLGYPMEEARALATVLSDTQADSLVARNEHDTIAIPVIHAHYFIAENFDRYLEYHRAGQHWSRPRPENKCSAMRHYQRPADAGQQSPLPG